MRTELKAKFIQHLSRKQGEKGFTLVELLVVIIIIGILAAIALPNFLNQGAKAKQTEARQNVGQHNRVQTVFRSENSSFASSFDLLAMGTLSGTATAGTTNYSYALTGLTDSSQLVATANDAALKGYVGGNSRSVNSQNLSVINGAVCEALAPAVAAPGVLTYPGAGARPTCPATTKEVGN